MKREFSILSSDGIRSYLAGFTVEEGVLNVFCSCPAGELGKWCKHKMALMSGDTKMPGDLDSAVIDELRNLVGKSIFPQLVDAVQQAEKDVLMAKTKLGSAKKALENSVRAGLKV
ncbi:SWIM zinc finger family protein [Sideroxydans sp.]